MKKEKIKSQISLSATIANVVVKNGYINILEQLFDRGYTKTTIVKEGMKLLATKEGINTTKLELD